MTPDYDRAASKAAEILVKYNIRSAPVMPVPIIKQAKNCNVVTFEEMSQIVGLERKELISSFDAQNRDAITSVYMKNGQPHYIVAYNMRLSHHLVNRAIAREMGHIALGHDGSLPEDVRMEEAMCFAHHLLCPRPLIHALQTSGIEITVEILGTITGCFEQCLVGMRHTPATHVPPELNRIIHERFADYVDDFLGFHEFLTTKDNSMIANFGSYMEGYAE